MSGKWKKLSVSRSTGKVIYWSKVDESSYTSPDCAIATQVGVYHYLPQKLDSMRSVCRVIMQELFRGGYAVCEHLSNFPAPAASYGSEALTMWLAAAKNPVSLVETESCPWGGIIRSDHDTEGRQGNLSEALPGKQLVCRLEPSALM